MSENTTAGTWPPAPANGMVGDIVFEAAALATPIVGVEPVQALMKAVSGLYARLELGPETVDGVTTYFQWEATLPSGTEVKGATVMTRNADGLLEHVAVHQRPLNALHEFSTSLGERLQGVPGIDPSIFYQGA
ncbi:nuclear transport factor 2 family protein [Curtobacterium sp. MCBD17_034]|uniref:nuclear transport factor 2 family protein n=1 Tax=unclassified Curtobacterium TaxID=257496 RepID=UPI000DA95C57|nr:MULTISPECIES: nuclear transport factor 2 family protein [unclassified Curtobacterium]PZF62128.1 nuclear transport factor 2 family protein [Curtobacterium sp. MCBD17_034]PZM33937.1 nuclear transport factor 2 family protein [Curtobacterium sp. MCBD17_031]